MARPYPGARCDEAGVSTLVGPVTSDWVGPARGPCRTRRRARPGDCASTTPSGPTTVLDERQRHRLGGGLPRHPHVGDAFEHRGEQAGRQPPPAPGDQPHRHLAAVRHGRGRARRRGDQHLVGARRPTPRPAPGRRRPPPPPRPAGGTTSASMSARCSRRTNDEPSSSASTASTRMSPRRMTASPIRSGQPMTHTVASSGSASNRWSGVRSCSTSNASSCGRRERVGGGQQRRAEPPQRTRGRMALDDPPAGDDQPGRLELQPADRARGLADEHPLIATRRSGHVPQSARSDAPLAT